MAKSLPKKMTEPVNSLNNHSILIHSPPKFGKSTFLASIPKCFIIATEPGYKSIKAYVEYVSSWQEALEWLDLLEKKNDFTHLAIDTVDNLFYLCAKEICDINDKQHYTDIPWGKGKDLLINEFRRFIFRVMDLNMGVIMTSHTQEVTIKARTGEYDKSIPTLHKFVRDTVLGEVDIILYGETKVIKSMSGKKETKRTLYSKIHPDYEAGDRTDRLDDQMELKKENGYAHIEAIYNRNRDAEENEPGNEVEMKPASKVKKTESKTKPTTDKKEEKPTPNKSGRF